MAALAVRGVETEFETCLAAVGFQIAKEGGPVRELIYADIFVRAQALSGWRLVAGRAEA